MNEPIRVSETNSVGQIKVLHLEEALIWLGRHHASHNINLGELAKHLSLSRCYVSRLIESLTGNGFNTHLKRIRLAHARELLESTKSSIKQIAWEVGYRHASNFVRDFKAEYCETPLTVRVSLKLETARMVCRNK